MIEEMTFNVRVVRRFSLPGYESFELSATLSDVPVMTSEAGIREMANSAVNAAEILREGLEVKGLAIKRDLGGSTGRPVPPTLVHAATGLAGAFDTPSPSPSPAPIPAWVGAGATTSSTPSPGGLRTVEAFGHVVSPPAPHMFEEPVTAAQIKKIAAMLSSAFTHWVVCRTILREMGFYCDIKSKTELNCGQASLVIDWYESASHGTRGRLFDAMRVAG